jgi:epoxide hydrolase-like predicted phosphatase
MWAEYLGELNLEMARYFLNLCPRYHTAIISNSFVGAREKEREKYQMEDLAELIIYSHEVGMRKPDAHIYALTCSKLGVSPSEMVFVDDRSDNVETARGAGMQAILFSESAQAIAEIDNVLSAERWTLRLLPVCYNYFA